MSLAIACLTLLAFIWVGYPVVTAALARLRRRPATTWPGEAPHVSVILATRESPEIVRERVQNLLSSEYPDDRLEVLVCVDAGISPPAREAVAPVAANVRIVIGNTAGSKAANVNAGALAAQGEVLVFADSGQRFAPDAVRRLVDALGDPRVGAASGRLVIGDAGGARSLSELYWELERRLRRDEAVIHSAVGVTGAIYAMRRERFAPMPDGLILDDLWTPMKLVLQGFRIAYVDDAVAFETRRFGIRDERRRKVRTLTGVLQLCRWLPAVLVPWRNPIWIQFVAHKLLRFAAPVLLTLALAGLAVEAWRAAASLAPDARAGVLLAASATVVVLVLVRPVRRVLTEFVQLHAAIAQATINGIRGNWRVW